jgi:hypothetical protein
MEKMEKLFNEYIKLNLDYCGYLSYNELKVY